MTVQTVAIIPARGRSKRIEHKNLRCVGGVPLVARAIVAAQRCTEIESVVVTTDDDEIARVAQEWGADVVERPAELASDTATSESALLHALDELAARGIDVDILAFLQATSPFIDSAALSEAIRIVRTRRRDTVFSAIETSAFLWSKGLAGAAGGVNHDINVRLRQRDRDPHYLETGAFYVMRGSPFRAVGHRFYGSIGVAEVAERTAIEVGTLDELAAACALAPLIDETRAIKTSDIATHT